MAPKKTGSRRKRTEADDELPAAADAPTQPLEAPPEPDVEPEPEQAPLPPLPPPAASPAPELCAACSGKGLLDGERCSTCGGTGRPPTPKRLV